MADPTQTSLVGQVVDGLFEIAQPLALGGVGEGYLAIHLEQGEKKVLKVIRPVLKDTPGTFSRIRQGLKALGGLQHRNIARIIDFGHLEEDAHFVITEHFEGPTLEQVVNRRGALPVDDALVIMAQLADALEHAHNHRVMHWNLNPQTIILQEGDVRQVTVTDFGLARLVADRDTGSFTLARPSLERSPFMAPEQLSGQRPGPPADIYALGALGSYLLSARRPVVDQKTRTLCSDHLGHDSGGKQAPPSVPQDLTEVLLDCQREKPAQRPSARGVLRELMRLLDSIVSKMPESAARDATVMMLASMDADQLANLATAPSGPIGSDSAGSSELSTEDAEIDVGVRLDPGLRINQYELIRELGRGGMGQVFLARDIKLGRRVAIKFLNTSSQKLTRRLLREARATARCNHENIVVIHEVNEHEGQPFMVLEYLEGEALSSLLKGSRLPPNRAIELMVPVVRALARAHEFDIVHRDLKPDNILVLSSGVIKVLDFGIAKVFSQPDGRSMSTLSEMEVPDSMGITRDGAIMGTLPYMSPEAWGMDTVDHRTDIFAVGIMLFEMVAGYNPLARMSAQELMANAAMQEKPMPGVGEAVPDLPGDLERIIDRCMAKRKQDRFDSARELLDALEPLLPGRFFRQLSTDESPYPGLTAFQEADAGKFFGRSEDIVRMVARVREHPLMAVVGSTGVGKSSLVRAGVIPALKSSGESWEVFISRPGRSPISSLASLIEPLTKSSGIELGEKLGAHHSLMERLRSEPGYLGTLLRSRARQKNGLVLLFVDQFEELYTLVPDAEERQAFMACLSGTADDPASPLRVVVSIRSDFLERVAEDPRFMEELTRGLYFLKLPKSQGIMEAITQPLEMVGYGFESPEIVEEMLCSLEQTSGALPLMQFAASKLWESRDRARKLLTRGSYEAMGGIAGALASHANEVLAGLAPAEQKLVRSIFGRLVTSEGTRAIVDVEELRGLSEDPDEARRVVDYLVDNRLLVVQTRSEEEGPAVEIVHESLITSWPTLRKWIDESQEDTIFLEQLRATAKQWEAKGRPQGLLWRGEAMEEARLWSRRYTGMLASRERAFLDAVLRLASRAARIRRGVVGGIIGFLLVLLAVGAVALVRIRAAERSAKEQAVRARREAQRARDAERRVKQQIAVIRAKEAAAKKAKVQVATGKAKLKVAESKLTMSYQQLEAALKKARREKLKAESATEQVRELLDKERARVQKLLREKRKIGTELR